MKKRNLQRKQLEYKILNFNELQKTSVPASGWVKAMRTSLGMSLEQLGKKLGISKQSALAIEKREKEGSLTLKGLKEAAAAMDMELVYGLVPKDGSLEALIDRKAYQIAKEIVGRASQSMVLEDQGNSEQRLRDAIDERAKELKEKNSKLLWD